MLGAVLTGGLSRRMGSNKALIEIDGVPMAERVARALLVGGCVRVVLIGGDAEALTPLGRPVVPDRHPGEGPLGGILTALALLSEAAPGSAPGPAVESAPDERTAIAGPGAGSVFVAACDLATLTGSAVRSLRATATARPEVDVVVARSARPEPALSIWRGSAAPEVQQLYDAGERALYRAIRSLRVAEVAVDAAAVRNVNTPDDLAR